MQKYDIALKEILRTPASLAATQLAGSRIRRWLDPHQPHTQSLQADLVGETYRGGIVHFEIQSFNDGTMVERMFEYCSGLFRRHGQLPHQVLVYAGKERLRMAHEMVGPDFTYRFTILDIRDLDGDKLIESSVLGDNVIAVLARLRNQRDAVHEILRRIASRPRPEREKAQTQLLTLARLRQMEDAVRRELEVDLEKEARDVPITLDLMENRVIGPMLRKAQSEGRLEVIRHQLIKRFGPLPEWAEKKLGKLKPTRIRVLSEKLLDATSLEELLR